MRKRRGSEEAYAQEYNASIDKRPNPQLQATMSHTPGPWHVGTGWIRAGELTQPDGGMSSGQLPLYGPTEANARLIAAAPDLLHWLERCVSLLESEKFWNGCETIKAAREAIAKARGQRE
jgi:hypothetical protein